MRASLAQRAPGIEANEALIQPMTQGLGEVLVGYKVDPQAGPIVMVAAGGIWAEVARDRSIRLAPVGIDGAREMIGEVRSLKALTGLRGKPRGDLDALARAISALSQLAVQSGPQVLEAEINPMMVMAEGHGVHGRGRPRAHALTNRPAGGSAIAAVNGQGPEKACPRR